MLLRLLRLLPELLKMATTSTAAEATSTGKTRLRVSLEGAAARQGPSIGQWLEFPGYSLARTVSQLGEDVSYPSANWWETPSYSAGICSGY